MNRSPLSTRAVAVALAVLLALPAVAVSPTTPQLPNPGSTRMSREDQQKLGLQAVAEIYKQIQAMVLDQMPLVTLAYLTPPIFIRDRVQNVDTQGTAAGRVDFRGIWLKQ